MTRFTKAHACGNDFLIVEGRADAALAVRLCARNTGVGADGVEFAEWTGERTATIRLVNADGSVAEISGNGTRCVAAWMAHCKGLKAGDTVRIGTDAGPRECCVVKAEGSRFEFAQGMGVPVIADKVVRLPDGTEVAGVVVSTGNPHFVIFVDGPDFEKHERGWQALGREICFHPDFPVQTNVEFVRVIDTNSIEIRIFERGVGPTTSSGTGTCATATASMVKRGLGSHLRVKAPGGEQTVDWAGEGAEILLTGPAELIATGEAW
ncbi:MAG TPA: diaminopimelate epimerase [Acidobacteriaceae bacterium]|nr:diaminopimelate epimerase [Acidobacteriaceae bacterium]